MKGLVSIHTVCVCTLDIELFVDIHVLNRVKPTYLDRLLTYLDRLQGFSTFYYKNFQYFDLENMMSISTYCVLVRVMTPCHI